LKEGLEVLFSLQKKDDLLKEIENNLKDIPRRISELEKERDSKSQIIEDAKKKHQINTEERKKLEHGIQDIRDRIQKYKDQMKKVTTNKEYQGFINEIKFEEHNISGIEENIIEKMVESDAIIETIRNTETEYQQITLEYNIKIKELQENFQYNQQKKLEETKNRTELEVKVEKDLLKAYRNLFQKKGGKVISFVESEFCGVCNIKLRPQTLSDLIISKDILVCENCGRILFKRITDDSEEQA